MENESNKHGNRKKGRSNGKNCRRKGIEKNRKIGKLQGEKAEARKKKKKRNENGTRKENQKSKQRKVGTGET